MSVVVRLLEDAKASAARGQLSEAHRVCLEILTLDRTVTAAWSLLGDIAWSVGDLPTSARMFQRASTLDPESPLLLARLSSTLVALNAFGEARAAADRALALHPDDPLTLEILAVTLNQVSAFGEAAALFAKAAALAPDRPGLLLNLAFAQQHAGDLTTAEQTLRRLVDIEPDNERAQLALVESVRQTPQANAVNRLAAMFEAAAEPGRRLALGHALAKSFDDLGDPQSALAWLDRAKASHRQIAAYDADADRRMADAAHDWRPGPAGPAPADAPIFVVGMPRTGTTLVERILSSHPDVASIGESLLFPALAKQAARWTGPLAGAAVFQGLDGINPPGLGEAYMRAAQALASTKPRLLDKLPFNFLYAGLIHQALPSARIVCLRRDPMDTCLANYRQLFGEASPFHDYAHDLGDIARYYVGFDRLIARWRAALPADRFMELGYEDLIARPEAESRRLVGFCGLTWDDRCLAFHENRAGVATASASQVRQPLYASSIGRWRAYGDGLGAAADVLRDACIVSA